MQFKNVRYFFTSRLGSNTDATTARDAAASQPPRPASARPSLPAHALVDHATARAAPAAALARGCVLLLFAVAALSATLRLSHAPQAAPLLSEAVVGVVRGAHRLTASAALLVIVAMLWSALRRPARRWPRAALPAALLALALALAVLGLATPGAKLPAVTLGNLLGGWLMLALAWRLAAPAPARGVGSLAAVAAVLVLAQAALGVMGGASFAGAGCGGLGDCLQRADGGGWPLWALDPWREPGGALAAATARMLHVGAAVLLLPLAAGAAFAAARLGRRDEATRVLALLAALALLGVGVAAFGWPWPAALAHSLAGALLLAHLVTLA